MLYTNVIKARVAFTAYARHARLGVYNAAMPVVHGFLERHHFHTEVPSLSGALGRFRSKVVKLQTWWKCVRTVRLAYVDLFMPMWQGFQAPIYKADAEKQAYQQQQRALADTRDRASSKRRSLSSNQRSGERQAGSRRGSGRDNVMTALERQKLIELAQDQLPSYVIKIILMDYIKTMQQSFRHRVQQWKEQREKDKFKHDLEGFGIVDDGAENEGFHLKPRIVYIDRYELEELVEDSVKKWKDGAWREIRHNRLRLLKWTFKWWQRSPQIARQAAAKRLEKPGSSPIPSDG